MLDAAGVTTRWLVQSSPLDVLDPPPYVRAGYRQLDREDEAAAQHWHRWSPDEFQRFADVVDQQRLEFSEEDTHANVRSAVARYLEINVIPHPECHDDRLFLMPMRLRNARQQGTIMYRRKDAKFMTIWDTKAGVPLLCPDDSREEGTRVALRYVPTIAEWRNNGRAVHKLVLNPPNIPRGELEQGMRELFKTFNRKFLKSGQFPEIKGALVTLEAPLSVRGDWNVHLNVILLCDGFLDYNKIVSAWGHQFDAKRLRGDQAQIEAAMREVIKYACQAMPSKSEHHKRSGGTDAPALTEWPADAFLEWWTSHQRFRRTRSYGLLFALGKPEPESMDGFEAIGTVSRDSQGRVVRSFPLLDSIPGDKSSTPDHRERLKAHLRRLTGPPEEHRRSLHIMKEALATWPSMIKTNH